MHVLLQLSNPCIDCRPPEQRERESSRSITCLCMGALSSPWHFPVDPLPKLPTAPLQTLKVKLWIAQHFQHPTILADISFHTAVVKLMLQHIVKARLIWNQLHEIDTHQTHYEINFTAASRSDLILNGSSSVLMWGSAHWLDAWSMRVSFVDNRRLKC